MVNPVDFCKKRYDHLKQQMTEHELDLVWLYGGAGMGPRFKRIADTTSGIALLVPIDGDPALYVYSVNYNSAVEESWLPVKLVESRATAIEQVSEYANRFLREGSRIGVNLDSLNHNNYMSYKEHMHGEFVDIGGTVIPEVFYGFYPMEIQYQRLAEREPELVDGAHRESQRRFERQSSEADLADNDLEVDRSQLAVQLLHQLNARRPPAFRHTVRRE